MKLKDYLRVYGITQKEFSMMMGLPQSRINMICARGTRDYQQIMTIMQMTHGKVTPKDLLKAAVRGE